MSIKAEEAEALPVGVHAGAGAEAIAGGEGDLEGLAPEGLEVLDDLRPGLVIQAGVGRELALADVEQEHLLGRGIRAGLGRCEGQAPGQRGDHGQAARHGYLLGHESRYRSRLIMAGETTRCNREREKLALGGDGSIQARSASEGEPAAHKPEAPARVDVNPRWRFGLVSHPDGFAVVRLYSHTARAVVARAGSGLTSCSTAIVMRNCVSPIRQGCLYCSSVPPVLSRRLRSHSCHVPAGSSSTRNGDNR